MSFSESITQSWRSQPLFPCEWKGGCYCPPVLKTKQNKTNSFTFSSQTLFEISYGLCWLSSRHFPVWLGVILQSFPKSRHSPQTDSHRPLGPALVSPLAPDSLRDASGSGGVCPTGGWMRSDAAGVPRHFSPAPSAGLVSGNEKEQACLVGTQHHAVVICGKPRASRCPSRHSQCGATSALPCWKRITCWVWTRNHAPKTDLLCFLEGMASTSCSWLHAIPFPSILGDTHPGSHRLGHLSSTPWPPLPEDMG